MDYSTPGFPVFHYLPEFAQTHIHWAQATTQMNLEDVTLNEISQTQKDKYWSHLYELT